MTHSLRILGISTLILATLLLLVQAVSAETTSVLFTVTMPFDAPDAAPGDGVCEATPGMGDCTLRAAVMETNTLPGADTIMIPPGVFGLTMGGAGEDGALMGDLDITDKVTITGSGAPTTTIDASFIDDRIFHVVMGTGASLELESVRIMNGTAPAGFPGGGGILNHGETLLVRDTWIIGNSADLGGGIFDDGVAEIYGSFIFSNTARVDNGGGILQGAGTMFIDNTLIRDNFALDDMTPPAPGMGGGIFNINAELIMTNSAVEWNAAYFGAGIFNLGHMMVDHSAIIENMAFDTGGGVYNALDATFSNVTFSENMADRTGFAIYTGMFGDFGPPAMTFMGNTTVAFNSGPGAGGGIANMAPSMTTVANSIVEGNVPSNCDPALLPGSADFNLDTDGSCMFLMPADFIAPTAMLEPLANNGAPLFWGDVTVMAGGMLYGPRTHALMGGSPAIDYLTVAACGGLADDQRFFPRPVDGDLDTLALCDIGAYEFVPPPPTAIQLSTLDTADASVSIIILILTTLLLGLTIVIRNPLSLIRTH